MASRSDFQCLKCGSCCRNTVETINGIQRGIILTKKETVLFPPETVTQQYAIGPAKKRKIVFYQMKVAPCPHLDNENKCRIYEKRPLICKSFPIMAGCISSKCKAFSYRKPGQTYQDIYPMSEMREASNKISRYITLKFGKDLMAGAQEWEFDLATKRWILRK